MTRLIIFAISAIVFASCAGPSAGTMTAPGHREAAAAHDEDAHEHSAIAESVYIDTRRGTRLTHAHLRQSISHAEHAAVHRHAAAKLEQSERAACSGATQVERDQCPLSAEGAVDAFVAVKNGYALRLATATNVAATQAEVDCHLAHAAAQGVSEADQEICPLFTPTLVTRSGRKLRMSARVEQTSDGIWLTLTSDDPVQRAEIERRLIALGLWGTDPAVK